MTATLSLSDAATGRVRGGCRLGTVQPGRWTVALRRRTQVRRDNAQARDRDGLQSKDVLIDGGVEEGTNVVIVGLQKLDPAQKVKVVSSLSF